MQRDKLEVEENGGHKNGESEEEEDMGMGIVVSDWIEEVCLVD